MEDTTMLKYDGTTVYDDFRDCCFHRGNTLQAPAMMIKILNAWYDKVKSLSEEQLKSIFPDDKHPSYNGVYFADWVVKYDKPTRFKPWPFTGYLYADYGDRRICTVHGKSEKEIYERLVISYLYYVKSDKTGDRKEARAEYRRITQQIDSLTKK